MSAEANKALVGRFMEAINAGDPDRLDDLMVEEYVHHDPNMPPEMQRGRDNYKQGIAMFHAAFANLHVAVEDAIAEGERVAARFTVRGRHQGELMGIPATGKEVVFSMHGVYRVASGRIAEGWVIFDALGMLQQLGAIPAPEQ